MSIPKQAPYFYEFGPFQVDVANRLLLRDGAPAPLAPKVLDALFLLVENQGRILEKGELMNQLWPDCFVEEGNLTQIIFQLRKALGESAAKQQYIETVPKRGYRFIASVRTINGEFPQRHAQPDGLAPNGSKSNGMPPPEFNEDDAVEVALENTAGALPGSEIESPALTSLSQTSTAIRPNQESGPETSARKSINMKIAIAATAIPGTIAIVILLALYLPWKLQIGGWAAPLKVPQTRPLTSSGMAQRPAISQDGKYIAYVVEEAGKQSVWIRQLNSTNDVRVVSPAEVIYRGVTFSPDGGFIYYVIQEKDLSNGVLYQTPSLGGVPRKILSGVDSTITFSPDGKRFAFARRNAESKETMLITANADGSGEQNLAVRKSPEFFSVKGPAWSPDGKSIAVAAGRSYPGDSYMYVATVDVATGRESRLGSQTWTAAGATAWLSDSSGVVVIAWPQDSPVYANQIYRLTYPKGEVSRLTNNLTSHDTTSIARQADELVTARSDRITHLWVAPNGDASQARSIKMGRGDNYSETFGLSWSPDGRLVYGTHASGNSDIWIMDADGGNQRQLTNNARREIDPVVTSDGRYIVYNSQGSGSSFIWRMNIDGSNPKQLTEGKFDDLPSLSPDGRWVVYTSYDDGGKLTLWKVAIEGGKPTQLTHYSSIYPVVSPDGKWIACQFRDEQAKRVYTGILPFAGGEPVKVFKDMPTPVWSLVRWTPDGRALSYIVTKDGVSNIWLQPVDGGKPKQFTHFKQDQIFRMAWSPDGKYLAYESGMTINDVILISDFR
jgi:Tol biopolymer transport system component/DNA-binding winged helix-turn-helix (wHTH) protein